MVTCTKQGDNDEERALQNAALILKTTQLLSSPKPQLRNAAMVCLNSLLQPSSIANWDANNTKVMSTFWKISSQAFRDISLQILQIRENEELLKQLLELQHKLMQHSTRFLNLNQVWMECGLQLLNDMQG